MKKISKYIFYFFLTCLIIISLWPGSVIGYLLYDDLEKQPDLIQNPFGTTINHFISYTYVSLLGFFVYLNDINFKKLLYCLLFLSITLELFHLIIPKRSFQLEDLLGNIFGVIVAYLVIKIYLSFNKS